MTQFPKPSSLYLFLASVGIEHDCIDMSIAYYRGMCKNRDIMWAHRDISLISNELQSLESLEEYYNGDF